MKVAVIVPTWNGADLLPACLDSLLAQEVQGCTVEIVVVDNGSVDETTSLVRSRYGRVALVELPENRGFAGGVNAGIRTAMAADATYVAVFNNDAVADTRWLATLIAAAERHPEAAIVTGKLLRSDGRIDSAGECYSTWGYPFPRGRDEPDTGTYDAPGEVFAATGGASLLRVAALRTVGLYDEDYFAYLEDVDLSFRARLGGWSVRYEPAAVAYHEVGATSGRITGFHRYQTIKNTVLLYVTNVPSPLFWRLLPRFVPAVLMLCAGAAARGEWRALGRAVWWLVRAAHRLPAKRRAVQRLRTIEPRSVESLLYAGMPPGQVRWHSARSRLTSLTSRTSRVRRAPAEQRRRSG